MVNNATSDQDVLERSLLALIQVLSRNRIKLFFALLLGGVLGIALSFTVPKKYTSRTELLPEFSSSKFGSLGSLASMAGLDGGGGEDGDALRPDLFPNILQSSSSILHLLAQPVQTDSGKLYSSLLDFYAVANDVKINPAFLKTKVSDTLYKFKPEETAVISSLRNSISSSFDKKSGIIAIGVEMTDATVAAMTLKNCLIYLKDYVSEYRYGKKNNQGEFLKSQLSTAKERMDKTRYTLQSYRDNNRNVFSNTGKIKEQKLQENYTIAFSIYNDLLGESERLNISRQEEKPLFQILEHPAIPVSKSSPNRLFFGVGGAISLFMVALLAILIPWKKIFSRS